MPNWGALSKAVKASELGKLEETIEVDGRVMKKRDVVEFEVEKRLKWGQSQADIVKALQLQGIEVDPNLVKERIAVARRRDPRAKNDPTLRKMEAEYIIQKGLQLGTPYDEISNELVNAGFNGPKLMDHVKAKELKRKAEGSAVQVDNGESGPNAGPPVDEMEAYRDSAKLIDLADEDLTQLLLKAGNEAAKRARAQADAARAAGRQKAEGHDWSKLQELGKMWSEPMYQNAPEAEGAPALGGSLPDLPARPSDLAVIEAERQPQTEPPPEQIPPAQ